MKALVAVLAGCLALGCVVGAGKADLNPLRRRASFDFRCAQKDLDIVTIDSRSYGVTGCYRRATYVESCQPGASCTWVLNGSIESTEPVTEQPVVEQPVAEQPVPAPAAAAAAPAQ